MPSIELRAQPRQVQSQALSPRLQHAVRLLQMSSLDFNAMLSDTLLKNPFLEADDGADEQGPGPPRGTALLPSADESELPRRADDCAPTAMESLADRSADDGAATDLPHDRDLWHADAGLERRRSDTNDSTALDMIAEPARLNTHLHGQLNVMNLPPRELALARAIVESLDDDGYLRSPLGELLAPSALEPMASLAEMQMALKQVQALDPAGVAAQGVAECLQLQLPVIECPRMRALALQVITEHLPALARRDVAGLARCLHLQPAAVEAVCDRIRHLDPRPGWRFGGAHAAYIVPDVVVKRLRGQWSVQLNPAVVPRLRMNRVYEQLFQRHRSAANDELGNHLQEARWTLRNVEQRFATILDVAQAIVRRQRRFFEYGAMAMSPLGLRDIADEVGVHESTVSRVTNNKFMATPLGVFELKYFFSRGMATASGGACTGTAIRGLIKDLIDAEPADKPLSDVQITRQLAQQGLVLARRTVTKYRQLLRIEAVDRRRRVAA